MTARTDRPVKRAVQSVSMPAEWINPDSDALFDAVLGLKTRDDARNLFRDLLTQKEIVEFSRRFKVARMLSKGYKYDDIEDATGMSSTTIARINQWLISGMGGYRSAIAKIHHLSPVMPRRGLS